MATTVNAEFNFNNTELLVPPLFPGSQPVPINFGNKIFEVSVDIIIGNKLAVIVKTTKLGKGINFPRISGIPYSSP